MGDLLCHKKSKLEDHVAPPCASLDSFSGMSSPLPFWKEELFRRRRISNEFSANIEQRGDRGAAPVATENRGSSTKKGLVAELSKRFQQSVYEPPPGEPAKGIGGGGAVSDCNSSVTFFTSSSPPSLVSCSSSFAIERMPPARPSQASSCESEPAPANQPSQLLGTEGLSPNIVVLSLSSSRTKPIGGRSSVTTVGLSTLPNSSVDCARHCGDASAVVVNARFLNTPRSVCKPLPNLSSGTQPSHGVGKLSQTAKLSTTKQIAMVEDTRSKSALASDVIDSKMRPANSGGVRKPNAAARDNYDDEELQYGPGIVNKLKSRYLSRTLRERPLGETRRPSLRRAASLEDWLDKDLSPSPQPLPASPVDSHSSASSPAPAGPTAVVSRQSSASSGGRNHRPVSLNLLTSPSLSPFAPTLPVVEPKSSQSGESVKLHDLKKTRSVDSFSNATTWRSVSITDLAGSTPPPLLHSQAKTQQPSPVTVAVATPVSPKTPVHLLLSKDAIVIVEKDDGSMRKDKTENCSSKRHSVSGSGAANAVVSHQPVSSPSSTATAALTGTSVPRARRTRHINSRYNVEEAELPAPDTVRQVKRIFESGSARKPSTRRSQSAGPGLNRVPLSVYRSSESGLMNDQITEKLDVQRINQTNLAKNAADPATVTMTRKHSDTVSPKLNDFGANVKPVIIAKPSPIGPKPTVTGPKPVSVPSAARSVIKTGRPLHRQPSHDGSPRNVELPAVKPQPIAALASRNTSVTAPAMAAAGGTEIGSEEEVDRAPVATDIGTKSISQAALDNIRQESTSVKFNFIDKDREGTRKDGHASLHSTSSPAQLKQIGIIRPQPKAAQTMEHVQASVSAIAAFASELTASSPMHDQVQPFGSDEKLSVLSNSQSKRGDAVSSLLPDEPRMETDPKTAVPTAIASIGAAGQEAKSGPVTFPTVRVSTALSPTRLTSAAVSVAIPITLAPVVRPPFTAAGATADPASTATCITKEVTRLDNVALPRPNSTTVAKKETDQSPTSTNAVISSAPTVTRVTATSSSSAGPAPTPTNSVPLNVYSILKKPSDSLGAIPANNKTPQTSAVSVKPASIPSVSSSALSPPVAEAVTATIPETSPSSATLLGPDSVKDSTNNQNKKTRHHQTEPSNTLHFNFVHENKKIDHIRNEGASTGVYLYKPNDSGITKLPDYDPGESSDFIDDLDFLKRPPSPCNVDFDGANVIVGKSLIRRRSKANKLNITFSDELTILFEYPSEASLLEDSEAKTTNGIPTEQRNRHFLPQENSYSSMKIAGGTGLSNYTPVKVKIENAFELGVSRPTLVDSPFPSVDDASIQVKSNDGYIKPSEESTTWSAESSSDLLF